MQRRVPAVLTALALAAAPALAGCGGNGDDTAAAPTTTATFRAPATTSPEPSAPTVPAPRPRDPTRTRTETSVPAVPTAPKGPTEKLTAPDASPPPRTPTEETVKRPADPVYCPGEGGGKTPPAKDRFDARELLGLSVAAANEKARTKGCVVRVVRRDGTDLVRTMDYSNARVNVTETKGRIVRLGGIG